MDDLPELDASTLLLTVNNRLARTLRQTHDARQHAAGLTVWDSPRILSWNAWLHDLYDELVDHGLCNRTLLDPHQESLLWEDIIRHAQREDPLLDVPAAARSARQAWQLLHDWRLPLSVLADRHDEEAAQLHAWGRRLREILQRNRWLTTAELPGEAEQALTHEATPPLPRHLLLAGFDQFTPMQLALHERLCECGCQVESWQPRPLDAVIRRLPCRDAEAECQAAACWARTRLEQDPTARLAIVSPALSVHRDRLTRWLARLLDPGGQLPGHTPHPCFDISLGRPLADWPVVGHLLLALQLCRPGKLPLHEISQLLRSPFLGGMPEEADARAALDRALHESGHPWLDRHRLLSEARRRTPGDPAACPRLIEHIEAVQAVLDELSLQDSPNAWAGHLLRLIEVWGWPGPPQLLNSAEYQQAQRLRQAVSEFSHLARVRKYMNLEQALKRFAHLCRDIDYQPQGHADGVQVLGMLEAADLRFDGLWLLGLDDATWPPAPTPNPLLPADLQRTHDMPHSSAARELRFARKLTRHLLGGAREIWVSHAETEGDDNRLTPSPLIATTDTQAPDFALTDPLYKTARHGNSVPLPSPGYLPPVIPPCGGTALLDDQSACPFRALARHRLGTETLIEPGFAPSPWLSGQMLHRLLEHIWSELGDSEALATQPAEVLRNRLRALAEKTVTELGHDRTDLFEGPLKTLEVERLTERALEWLDHERRRPAHFRVVSLEVRETLDLAGLPLHVRADRIDTLDDGRHIIIDYKTGRGTRLPDWKAERLPEPQVPLYAVYHPPVAGAVLAHIHPDGEQTRFFGLCAEADLLPKASGRMQNIQIPDDWEKTLQDWRERLERLAREVLEGRVEIAPRDADTCRHCDLGGFCRIGPPGGRKSK